MNKYIKTLLLCAGVVTTSQQAMAVPCGFEHEIQRGDSLSVLSEMDMHYGLHEFWPVLYAFNRDRIGNDPNLIFPGIMLRIPCLDDDGQPLPGQFTEAMAKMVHVHNPAVVSETKTVEEPRNPDPAQASESEKFEEPASPDPVQVAATDQMHDANHSGMSHSTASAPGAGHLQSANIVEPKAETVAALPVMKNQMSNNVNGPLSVRLLTADDFGLFADKNIYNNGLATNLVSAALRENAEIGHYEISKVNDWSAHIDPLLINHSFDVGFPWLKPDCANQSESNLCKNFLFTDPILIVSNLLFVLTESPLDFERDDDIFGKTLCRPSGNYTNDLDSNGRNWLIDKKVWLKQPASSAECFEMLLRNEVDAVAINEFNGRSTIRSLRLEDRVRIIATKPVSRVGLYGLVHRGHPSADHLLALMNQSVNSIRNSGTYANIVNKAIESGQ